MGGIYANGLESINAPQPPNRAESWKDAMNTKRILNITIKRIDDTDPDTSYLGSYSNSPESEFSIDRRHTLDCASVSLDNKRKVDELELQFAALDIQRIAAITDEEAAAIVWKQDAIVEQQEALQECDCDESGDARRGEYQYFNPATTDPHNANEVNRRDALFAYRRMERLHSGDWGYISISAEAEIQLNTHSTIQIVRSSGLSGTESDSSKEHLAEIEDEELSSLRDELYAMGFSKRAIATAVKNAEK